MNATRLRRAAAHWMCAALALGLVACDDGKGGGGSSASADAGGGGQGGAGGSSATADAGVGGQGGFGGEGGQGGEGGAGGAGGESGEGGQGGEGGAGGESGFGGGGGQGGAGGQGGGGGQGGAGGEGGEGGGVDPVDPGFETGGNTNINLGGAQDLGFFRGVLNQGVVPRREQFDPAGFFAEHHTPLPAPDCGERVCLQAMLGAMANLLNGNNCTLLQVGLNSPLVADANHRPPLNLVVSVDVSGSMAAGDRIGFVRLGLDTLIDALHDEDQLAIVTYSNGARVLVSATEVRGNRPVLRAAVAGLAAGGGTNLHDGLALAYDELDGMFDGAEQNRVILLSDGNPTEGITETGAILRMSDRRNVEGVGLTTIGVGTDFNQALMLQLAQQGDGNAYFVENVAAVTEVFGQEISFFTVPVAYDVSLEVRAGSNYTFIRAFGSSLWVDAQDGSGGGLDVSSVFLAHRQRHDDVGPGGTRRGGGSALLLELMPDESAASVEVPEQAEVTLRYREPGTNRIVEQSTVVSRAGLPVNNLPARGERFFDNPIVEKNFVILNVYLSIATALDLYHFDRDHQGAIDLVDRMMAVLASYNSTVNEGTGDVDLELDIVLLNQLMAVMVANSPAQVVTPDPEEWDDNEWPHD